MPTQHNAITDPNIHEPKGVAGAAAGASYVANGSGSGTWKKIDSTALSGLTGDGTSNNKILLTNGTNGFALKEAFAHGSMVLTNNTNAFTVAAASDASLATNSDYVLFTGTGAPLAAGPSQLGVAFSASRITVPANGVYKVDVCGQITGFPTTTARVGARIRVNGSTYGSRRSMAKGFNAGDLGQFNLNELIALNANDYIELYIASSAAGGLTISDLTVTAVLVRAT